MEGEVIAVGPGARDEGWRDRCAGREVRRPHPVRQVVRTEVKIDGEELLIMKESDIMGNYCGLIAANIQDRGR